ncbi:MAG: hypothetical protein ACM31P_04260 [Actinomycetota bacterium]
MQLRSLQHALAQIAAVIVVMTALLAGYVWLETDSAKSKAEAVCQRIPVGTSYEMAFAEIARIDAEPRLRTTSSDFLSVGFRGAAMDRWLCNLRISDGRVAGHEIRLLD